MADTVTQPFTGHTQAEWDALVRLIVAYQNNSVAAKPDKRRPTDKQVLLALMEGKDAKSIKDLITAWQAYDASKLVHHSVKRMIKTAVDKTQNG